MNKNLVNYQIIYIFTLTICLTSTFNVTENGRKFPKLMGEFRYKMWCGAIFDGVVFNVSFSQRTWN